MTNQTRHTTPLPPDAASHPTILTHGLINNCLKLGDILCLVLAAHIGSLADGNVTLAQSYLMSLLAIQPFRLVSGNRRVYRWDRYRSLKMEIVDILAGLCAGAVVALIFCHVFHPGQDISRWFLYWIGGATLSIGLLRAAARQLVRQLNRRGLLFNRVAVIGAGEEGAAVISHLKDASSRNNNYRIVGVFDERAARHSAEIQGIPVVRGLDPLIEMAQTVPIDAILVALPTTAKKRIVSTMARIRILPADILLLMDVNWLNLKDVQVRDMQGGTFLQLARRPLIGTRALVKLVEDYVVATIGILVTSPIMLATCIALRLEGEGPILFRQKRIGFNHREIDVLKFRSMRPARHDDGRFGTRPDDPRITRIGRFIRKYSIDELPQLFNVLRGELSIVGPRAHVPEMLIGNRTYVETIDEYAARHRVKPGITGWAQINGMRGGIHTEERAQRGVELDIHYIENWSLWLDVVIMFRTLFGGLWGRQVF